MSDVKRIALTFDVELWHETDWLKPYIKNSNTDNDSFEDSVRNILTLLRKYNYSATFFVTDTVVRLYPNIVREISLAGNEVGSHGIGHVRLPKADPEHYRAEFRKHIEAIEEITKKKVAGFRAPHFSLNKQSGWIIGILKDSGLRYDSSIIPSKVAEYGNPNAPTEPYMISEKNILLHDQDSRFQEIPVSVYGKFRAPFAGGIYFRLLPFWMFRLFLRGVMKKSYPPVLYFHPHELDPKTPRITRGPWIKRHVKYSGVNTSFRKLEMILKDYRCDSIENIFF